MDDNRSNEGILDGKLPCNMSRRDERLKVKVAYRSQIRRYPS